MEKKIILLILIVFVLVTGCSVTTLDSADYSHNVDAILSTEKGKAYNTYFEGYKYYLPKELKFLEKDRERKHFSQNLSQYFFAKI